MQEYTDAGTGQIDIPAGNHPIGNHPIGNHPIGNTPEPGSSEPNAALQELLELATQREALKISYTKLSKALSEHMNNIMLTQAILGNNQATDITSPQLATPCLTVVRFLENHCEVTNNYEDVVFSAELYTKYLGQLRVGEFKYNTLELVHQFKELVGPLGVSHGRYQKAGVRARGFRGLRLK